MENKNDNLDRVFFPFPEKDFRETFQWRIFRIMAEFVEGFHFVADFKRSVSIFGSARFDENNPHYQKARELGKLLAKENFTVVTGGGPGIMEGGNRGAYENNGNSVGINIELIDQGERRNQYLNSSIGFHYFFTRKVMLSFASYGYVYFPGGFGTLDELFEMLTLIQTKKLPQPVTIVLVGKDFWTPMLDWAEETLRDDYKTVSKEDLDLIQIVDEPEEALELIKKGKPFNR